MRRPRIIRRKGRVGLRRGIFLLPSLFTVANIFCGFFSAVEASRGRMELAAVFILVATVADILDGRIARLTGASSSFGEVFDSLADVVSFGMAPALLVFHWGLWQTPRVGIAASFLILVAVAIRLARFTSSPHDLHDFAGLPSPAGAGSIALFVLVSPSPVKHPGFVPVVGVFAVCLALLMVSNLPYRSFKDVDLRRRWPATSIFIIALAFSLITLTPHVLSVMAATYVLSAPVAVLTKRLRRRPSAAPSAEHRLEQEQHAEDPDH
ncbi:MAG TPA: CDP-diacylglycerol--serine O-phosphatidyltransferase [Thermoanaerobaculales bacterium]|nr:CDP-diacylglycerol--serine O-phosphatidyltransferase [Thermoanaerobaculales bacterium]HPA82079.1 CDP-diacylglycerol--serine O-phosphatidyltransferase [Thermoanaerobaculales bacterium]HQL29975.1 CDP-diacylglycerol--serine O-phosphatidyltransferase [Thermoanaerobaculales bacterium]HQN96848.1 CDP-diacylglycerol--serine O-phosphatidyltransferase [Thermoanaerobaculales bacterium]